MDIPPYPLYNRTFTLYRASPLHHGSAPLLAPRALRTHAKRLSEQLKGDSIRGVDVAFAAASHLGPLESCTWDLLGDEDSWIDAHQLQSPTPPPDARGVLVTLDYPQASYTALLLRDPRPAPPSFTALPLLLVKMPAPVRDVFLQYLRTSFDAHVAPLRLPSSFIAAGAETYLRHLGDGDSVRQLSVQLAFPSAPALAHIDITIGAGDVAGFVARGADNTLRDKTLGDKTRGDASPTPGPFTAALTSYLRTHLALSLTHPGTTISLISATSFSLGTSRLKLSAPDTLANTSFSDSSGQDASPAQLAVEEVLSALVREAGG
ncbi:kinetochore complex Sim4 subunit Fta1-domain-containing protein [Boeremia exigua]|uniref:kinetochore complex Sim4 subunit Fta1-domain-containing protein n=1 Tax=Boeremia exigua TaxID=749465 RepID=UPI001E8EBB35|nr:kinetochore complex Sim4 subunit Fta1-domain-containing protein [Boeremia exigua]KAH6629699.1 kinetochore complex Sim4 subunit Fta1-domain-containing protein [Boeremia exigua]